MLFIEFVVVDMNLSIYGMHCCVNVYLIKIMKFYVEYSKFYPLIVML